MNGPGEQPEVIGKTGICWRRSCDNEFREYWRKRLKEIVPRFSQLDGIMIEIGVTDNVPCFKDRTYGNLRPFIRLNAPPHWLADDGTSFYPRS